MKRGNVKKNHKNNLFGIFQNAQFKNYYKIENNLILLQSIYILKKRFELLTRFNHLASKIHEIEKKKK